MERAGDIPREHNIQPGLSPRVDDARETAEVSEVRLGFREENSIEHRREDPTEATSQRSSIRLPKPERSIADATPEMQEELDNSTGRMANMSLAGVFQPDEDGFSAFNTLTQQLATAEGPDGATASMPVSEEIVGGLTSEQLIAFDEQASDVFTRVVAIKSAPPEVLDRINSLNNEAMIAIQSGNLEDVSALLAKIQTELQDTRIQFDQEALKTAQQTRKMQSQERIHKLKEAIKKAEKAKKSGLLGKIFGGIATALAVAVSAVMIASGVLTKVGVVLMVASIALMTTMMVSQNTGNWMNKVFGDSQTAQLIAGIMWAVISIALSMGAGCCTSGAGAAQAGTQAAKMASYAKMAGHAGRLTQAGATAGQGGAEMHAAQTKYEGAMYHADATEIYAQMQKMQFFIEDLTEALERSIREISEGQEIASSMMRDVLNSKYTMAKNI
ncbi:MAG: type III secretion system translocon subunit SctE [Endozoicomonadaceae bacterium]|nr:type III secretion system translocon subunit SctE [Endozoicomonadaceae bacterium]